MNEKRPTSGYAVSDDEIDLGELAHALWARKLIILAVTTATTLLAVIYLHIATYTYSARMMLTPAQSSGSTLSSKLGGLGDLASLAGINMPQDSSALAFPLYIEGVYSRDLADALARHQDLMRVIFHSEWNTGAGRWQEPVGFSRSATQTVKRIIGAPLLDWSPPEGSRLQEFITENVSVEQDSKKPFATLVFNHEDPVFAVRFVNTLHAELDNMLRAKALERANANVEYLSAQLSRVTIAEHREALAQALSEQEKQRMAASSSAPYAAEPFGEATASRKPTSPRPVLVLATSIIGGLLLGVLVALGVAFIGRTEVPGPNDSPKT